MLRATRYDVKAEGFAVKCAVSQVRGHSGYPAAGVLKKVYEARASASRVWLGDTLPPSLSLSRSRAPDLGVPQQPEAQRLVVRADLHLPRHPGCGHNRVPGRPTPFVGLPVKMFSGLLKVVCVRRNYLLLPLRCALLGTSYGMVGSTKNTPNPL